MVAMRAGNVFGTAGIQITSQNGPRLFSDIADGIYAVAEKSGPITKIIGVGDRIGQSQATVSALDMGPEPLDANGKLVFWTTFSCVFQNCPMGDQPYLFEADLIPTRNLDL